jgi:hypothetical protein
MLLGGTAPLGAWAFPHSNHWCRHGPPQRRCGVYRALALLMLIECSATPSAGRGRPKAVLETIIPAFDGALRQTSTGVKITIQQRSQVTLREFNRTDFERLISWVPNQEALTEWCAAFFRHRLGQNQLHDISTALLSQTSEQYLLQLTNMATRLATSKSA